MPAEGRVSIIWQIIFVLFIPIADIWAFYRIKKLQKAILYLFIPAIALMAVMFVPIIMIAVEGVENNLQDDEQWEKEFESNPLMLVAIIGSSIGYTGLAILSIYLIYKWSEEWNKRFEDQ